MRPGFEKQLLFIFVCLLFTQTSANAQLNVSFTSDKTGGCAPLAVHFTNTSYASSSAVYKWDFGNGNTSALKDPGAVFLDKKSYTVTLTVTDGNETSSSSKTIIVYQDPVVDFTSSLKKVCTPDPTIFSANASADNGSIVNYTWDFGDGYTQSSYHSHVAHSYMTEQDPTVRLTVIDNHGCTGTKTKSNIIKVFNGINAAFDADKTFICFQSDPVQLNNKSEGEGPLSYTWDFGDGTKSARKDPSHVFNTKGIYTVKLAIQNANGCADTMLKVSYLNVGNFSSQFSVTDIICQSAFTPIKNTSNPDPDSYTFFMDSTQTIYPDYYGNYYCNFTTPGQHTISLTNHFGGCDETITKKVEVKGLLHPGFKIEINDSCPRPLPVNFIDTTSGAVKSEWNFIPYTYPIGVQATGRSVSYNFGEGDHNVTLFVTDSNGCTTSTQEPLSVPWPQVYITTVDGNGNNACDSLTKTFKAVAAEPISQATWIFDDGTTSTETEPTRTFGPGSHGVTLRFYTGGGCKREVYYYNIEVAPKVRADFVSESGTEICGNSFIRFNSTQNYNSSWDIWLDDGNYVGSGYYTLFDYQFQDTGMHTITHIVYNNGCNDTMTRVNYLHVSPSFPKISKTSNTCDGDRGMMSLSQTSRYATKWLWNFGDNSSVSFDTNQIQIEHHYSKSGQYEVVLTTTNGACVNSDSTTVFVLLKQHPVLASSDTNLCDDEALHYTITNLDLETHPYVWVYHYVDTYEYNDGSTFAAGGYNNMDDWIYQRPYNGIFNNLLKGKDSIRIITREAIYDCLDTTNFIPIKIHGAVAGFEALADNICFHLPFSFKDTSNASNTTITSRTWNFGDGKTLTTTSAGIVTHAYENPGSYYVTLAITDASGCTSTTSTVSHMVNVNGPKAVFSTYGSSFHMNVPMQFYNSTNNYNSYNTEYQWNFGDGHTSSEYNPYYTYINPGTYTIRLVARNPDTGCSDTVSHTITVLKFNANFSFNSSFVNSVECDPVLVQFTNTSHDYASVKWDFGDGFTCGNVNTPSHVYAKPGKYIVQLFVTGNNGLLKTYTDSVFVKNDSLEITTNMHRTCTAQSVTLSAVSKDASSYLWDFGDGTLAEATDSVSVHHYQTAGNYVPKLIAEDASGCASSVSLKNTVSIDSLNITLNSIPRICAPKEVQFSPAIVNIASDGGEQSLNYHWDFGTGNKSDSANIKTPSFTFPQAGNYQVTLNVASADGCKKQAKVTIVALQGLGGKINGPSEICVQNKAGFTGSTLLPGEPVWQWIYADGTTVSEQNPPAKEYDEAGDFTVKLVVDNNGCKDTVSKILGVHSNPEVTLSAKEGTLCEGASFPVTAGGGVEYSWTPSAGLNTTGNATVIASPLTNTNYTVSVTNGYGCTSKDSVLINVIHPFTLQLAKEIEICSWTSTRLNASGAVSYRWINNTQGLNNSKVPDPVASPSVSTVYTLVASGQNQCFSDTAQVNVIVKPTPVIHLGNDTTICEGQSIVLNAFTANATYAWQDGSATPDFKVRNGGEYFVQVNLNNCKASDTINVSQKAIPYFKLGEDSAICEGEEYVLNPVLNTNTSYLWQDGSTAPSFVIRREGIYSLTASNECGSHSDSITITKGLCNMLMPNAFSPNNDGLNDVFRVKYPFAVTHFHFLITNSWGQTVFETNDIHKGWNGTLQGEPSVSGIYVWVISFTDIDNKDQQIKGTVTLLR